MVTNVACAEHGERDGVGVVFRAVVVVDLKLSVHVGLAIIFLTGVLQRPHPDRLAVSLPSPSYSSSPRFTVPLPASPRSE